MGELKIGGCAMEMGLFEIVGLVTSFAVVVATSVRRGEHGSEDRWAFTLFADDASETADFDAEDAVLSQAAEA
jgi:hypothetical protein